MARLVPPRFLTFREAVSKVEEAMFAGVPDREEVKRYRERGYPVGDGASSRKAADELWDAVDQSRLTAMGIGRQPFRVNKLPNSIVQIPAVRRTGDFSYLRPGNEAFEEVARAFECRPATIALAFRERDIEKLCSKLRQRRRRTALRSSEAKKPGRPPLRRLVRPTIVELVDNNRWNTLGSLKGLVQAIKRKTGQSISQETAGRYLDNYSTKPATASTYDVRRRSRADARSGFADL
jgi:hypothetical protein